MNILFFLTPKSSVEYIDADASLLKTVRKMRERNYSAIPIVDKEGRYVGTINSGDILGYINENNNLSLKEASAVMMRSIPRIRDNKPVSVDCRMEDIIDNILIQNFIPVVDDDDKFIGIITRGDVIKYMNDCLKKSGGIGGEKTDV